MTDFKPKGELPRQLETVEDYVQTCENFVLPLFYQQIRKAVRIIEELHAAIEQDKIEQERVDFCINEIKELAAFANENSSMYPYFQQVAKLEQRLSNEGLIRDDTKSS